MYLPHVFPQSLDCETSIHVILYRALSRDVTTLTSNQKLGAGVLTFHVGHKWNVWLMANFFILHVYIISEGLIMQRQPGCLCFKCSTCVSSIRVSNDKVNLCDSWLYHNVIERKLKNRSSIWLVQTTTMVCKLFLFNNRTMVVIVECLLLHFVTCLTCGILPQTVQFDTPRTQTHLLRCLKLGQMEFFQHFKVLN